MQFNESEILHLIPDGFDPEIHEHLERFKQLGRELQLTASSSEDKARGVLVESYCHYHRSRNAAVSNKRKHPEFEEYGLHWLFSDRNLLGNPTKLSLSKNLIRPQKLKIEPGQSYFHYGRRK